MFRPFLVVALLVTACSDDGGTSTGTGRAPFRRLTRFEYNNTVKDLMGTSTRPADTFPPEEQMFGFDNNSEYLTVSSSLAERYLEAAELLADEYTIEVDDVLPGCTKVEGESCAVAFIESFGRRAFRRPLTQEEVDAYTTLWREGEEAQHFDEGIEMVIAAMLQSPHFLYRVEFGMPPEEPGQTLVKPTPYEMASRLSYMLWASMPDDELLDAAEAGTLTTADEIEAQARRMVADARVRSNMGMFFTQWLELEQIESLEKSSDVYPNFDNALRPYMMEETQRFVDEVMWEGGGDISALFTASYTYVNKSLADFYGVDGPASDDEWTKVELDPARTAGLLTQGGILSMLSKPNQSSPIHRGKWVRERLFCETLTPPPPELEIKPPDLDPNLTTRERFSQHRDDPFCATCHEMMDPIGLGFEHYDGVGLWRENENGLAIDDSGEVVGTDVAGTFNGPVELGQKLAESDQVKGCVSLGMFRYGFGRTETDADAGTLETLRTAFGDGGLSEFLVAMTRTDAFLLIETKPADGGAQ